MINEENIDAIDRWLATLVCSFFPGLLVLDYVFGKGLFSSPPSTIYEFALTALYAASISFLFVYPAQSGMEKHFGASMTDRLKSHEIGIITVLLVILLALTAIGLYVLVEACGNYLGVFSKYARLVNCTIAFAIMFGLSIPGNKLYFGWYKKTFHTGTEQK